MPKLPKAPLQEVIFEIRWDLDIDSGSGQNFDRGFQLAQGKLQEFARGQFPDFKRKIPHGIPEQLFNYQAVNQYWSKNSKWPVLQLGPGIFTVNDTEANYDWAAGYYSLLRESLNWVVKAYDGQLRIGLATLRYLDSVRTKDYGFEGRWQDFVAEHFNFSFVNSFDTRGPLKAFNFSQNFELNDSSSLHIRMNSGKFRSTNDDALIWETAVSKADQFDIESLLLWVETAHSAASDLFKEMTKQHFYDSFR